jgi:hypothetical protein
MRGRGEEKERRREGEKKKQEERTIERERTRRGDGEKERVEEQQHGNDCGRGVSRSHDILKSFPIEKILKTFEKTNMTSSIVRI